MRYVSVCAGIEAASCAWHPLGWTPVLFSEIEPFPCAVLKHHYPEVPLVGDFTQLILNPPEADLLVGGTPCQAFSVAGKRLSLEDYRGNLSLAFADLFHAGRYRWAVWENVPGVLSTKDNAFGCLLGRLVGSDTPLLPGGGNKWTNAGVVSGPQATAAWRVLDAQYFGVAQRRRRVFVCVSRGAGFASARALLPVGESLSRHPPARPQAGEGIARAFETGPGGGRFTDLAPTMDARAKDGPMRNQLGIGTLARSLTAGQRYDGETETFVVQGGGDSRRPTPTLNAAFAEKQGLEDQHINGGAGMFVLGAIPINTQVALRHEALGEGTGLGIGEPGDPAYTLQSAHHHAVFAIQNPMVEKQQNGLGVSDGPMYTLESSPPHGVAAFDPHNASLDSVMPTLGTNTGGMGAGAGGVLQLRPRRLTPEECEKLQGFPVGWTNIPWKKGAPDGPRYKALGNSMAVPVMAYIGKRIQLVEDGQC